MFDGAGGSLDGGRAPDALGVAGLEGHTATPEDYGSVGCAELLGGMGVEGTDGLDGQVFLFVDGLGRTEIDPPAVVVNLPPELDQRVLLYALEGEGEHADVVGVDGGEIAKEDGGEAEAGAGDGGEAVEAAGADVIESLLAGFEGVFAATVAPPDVLGPFLADAGEIALLLVFDDAGGDADVVVAFLGNLGAFPEGGEAVEEGEVEDAAELAAVNLAVVGVAGVLHGEGPVHGPNLGVALDGDFGVKELFGDVFFEGDGFGLAHPDVDDALVGLGGVVAGFELGGELGIGAVGEGGDALAGAVEGVAVVGAGDEALELVVALAVADAAGEVGPAVGAGVLEGGDLVAGVAEEDDLVAADAEGDGLALDVLLLDAGVPVLAVARFGDVVVEADAGGTAGGVLGYPVSAVGTVGVGAVRAVGVMAVGGHLVTSHRGVEVPMVGGKLLREGWVVKEWGAGDVTMSHIS